MGEFTVLVIAWIVCGLISGGIASSRGASAGGGFFLGLLLGPVGILISCFMGGEAEKTAKQVTTGQKKVCPRCAEAVQRAALVCRYCGHEFSETEAPVSAEVPRLEQPQKGTNETDFIAVVGVFIGLAALAMLLLNGMLV